MARVNPFRPNNVIAPGMFAGRIPEVNRLDQALLQAKFGNPFHFAVIGERGIGKSSLFLTMDWVAKGDIDPMEGEKFNFVVVNLTLESNYTQTDIICALGSMLRTEMIAIKTAEHIASTAWDFLKKWEILGVAYHEKTEIEARPFELLNELIQTISEAEKKTLECKKDGILFLIDEADKPDATAHLGQTMKVLTESLAKRGTDHVLFGLAGLPELYDVLKRSHESAARVFEPIELKQLQHADQVTAIDRGLSVANKTNIKKTTITEAAQSAISDQTEGYPHFLQQFAYCAFDIDTDYEICENDVLKGAFGKNGAIEKLGIRYFRDTFSTINSSDYRKVLHALAKEGSSFVSKKTLRERTKIKETVLSNALNTLKERKVIVSQKGKLGYYRLHTKALSEWIIRFSEEATSTEA